MKLIRSIKIGRQNKIHKGIGHVEFPASFTLIPGVILILVSIVFIFSPAPVYGKINSSAPSSQAITYTLSQFADGKARYFQYKTPTGQTIRFFIVRSSDGVVRAAFDACDVCWPSGKGYAQNGNVMVCRNCGQRFLTAQINVVTGGCNPAALNREIGKTELTIRVKDILAGQHYFNY